MLSSVVSEPTRAQQSCNPRGVYEATAACGAKSECRPQRLAADTHSTSCQAAPNLWRLLCGSVTTAATAHRRLEHQAKPRRPSGHREQQEKPPDRVSV